jgi:hypothetical protein
MTKQTAAWTRIQSSFATLWAYAFMTLAYGYIGGFFFSAFYTSFFGGEWDHAFSIWSHLVVWMAAWFSVAMLRSLDRAYKTKDAAAPPIPSLFRRIIAYLGIEGKNPESLYAGILAVWPFLCFYFLFFVSQFCLQTSFFVPRPATFPQFLFAILDVTVQSKIGDFLQGTEFANYRFSYDQSLLINKVTVTVGQVMIAYLLVRRVQALFKKG